LRRPRAAALTRFLPTGVSGRASSSIQMVASRSAAGPWRNNAIHDPLAPRLPRGGWGSVIGLRREPVWDLEIIDRQKTQNPMFQGNCDILSKAQKLNIMRLKLSGYPQSLECKIAKKQEITT